MKIGRLSGLDDSGGGKILLSAAWFGLVTGLVEAIIFFSLQKLGRLMGVWTDILWIAMVFDLLLFGVTGVFITLARRRLTGLRWMPIAVFIYALMAWVNWTGLALGDRMHPLALGLLVVGFSVTVVRLYRSYTARFLALWRFSLPWLAGVAGLAFTILYAGKEVRERLVTDRLPEAAPGAPDILVIVVDALRADHLSGYGYARQTSPNLDALIRQGASFYNAFSTSSYTLPSHASLVTGQYPNQHNVEWDSFQSLFDSSQPTIGEALMAQGYRTGAFSGNVFWFSREQGFGRGFVHFEDFFHNIEDMALRTAYGRMFETLILQRMGDQDIPARKSAASTNRSLLKWIEQDRSRPFFAIVNYMDVHDPYLPPEPFRSKFSEFAAPGGLLNWRVGRSSPRLNAAQLQSEIGAYDGAIAYTDDQIGLLLRELKKRGVGENLLVIVTSDHGEAFGEHQLYLHGHTLYREVIQVPLILWWPGKVPENLAIQRPVSNAALAATVMDMLGGKDRSFSGPSLAAFWKDTGEADDWPLPFAALDRQPWVPDDHPVHDGWMMTLVSPQYQYIEYESMPGELFRWTVDPREATDLAKSPEFKARLGWFRTLLRQFVDYGATARDRPGKAETAER